LCSLSILENKILFDRKKIVVDEDKIVLLLKKIDKYIDYNNDVSDIFWNRMWAGVYIQEKKKLGHVKGFLQILS